MYEEIVTKTNEQVAKLAAPVKKFNALVLDHLEKFVQFQLEAAKSYSDLGLEQLRAALDVKDAESLQTYVSGQQKVVEVVGKKLSSDAETLATLSKDFTVEVQKLAQENVAVLVPAKAEAKKPAARRSA